MVLNDESTWPPEVIRYLDTHQDLFSSWELRKQGDSEPLSHQQTVQIARAYDDAVEGLREVLMPFTLHGYHCTRLTDAEIEHILSQGMQPPSQAVLADRIDRLRSAKLIDTQIAERLKRENQANENNRAGMIWFCFFSPHVAGQSGIERFFRSWGGEALYNCHERDPITGPILTKIGTPCLIEADVPIASFPRYTFLESHVYRQFLINRGFETSEPCEHEDRATLPLPSENIRRVIRFPEDDFLTLTGCADWIPPIMFPSA